MDKDNKFISIWYSLVIEEAKGAGMMVAVREWKFSESFVQVTNHSLCFSKTNQEWFYSCLVTKVKNVTRGVRNIYWRKWSKSSVYSNNVYWLASGSKRHLALFSKKDLENQINLYFVPTGNKEVWSQSCAVLCTY